MQCTRKFYFDNPMGNVDVWNNWKINGKSLIPAGIEDERKEEVREFAKNKNLFNRYRMQMLKINKIAGFSRKSSFNFPILAKFLSKINNLSTHMICKLSKSLRSFLPSPTENCGRQTVMPHTFLPPQWNWVISKFSFGCRIQVTEIIKM